MIASDTVHHKGDKLVINHVMSSDLKSRIFDDFLNYLNEYREEDISHVTSVLPLPDVDVYHFHRPQLVEEHLPTAAVVTVHHDLADSDPSLDFARFSQPYKDAARIVCLNSQQQKWLGMRGYSRIEVIPHGYNTRFLHPLVRTRRQKIILGLASRRYGRRVKGEALLLEIAKRLSPDRFAFILVGPGRSHEGQFLQRYGFETRVFEHLPYRLFQQFYQEIDALLILSWHEGGPACVPEAIATGTPIISTPVGMVVDYLEEGRNGFLLTRNPEIDAERIEKLASDPHFHQTLNKGAQDLTKTALSWREVALRYHKVYREVCYP